MIEVSGPVLAISVLLFFAFVYVIGSALINHFFRRKAEFVDDLHEKISEMKGKPDGTPK